MLVVHRGTGFRFALGGGVERERGGGQDAVVAPLPGILLAVSVAAGDVVGAGEVLGVLESMKMEYTLTADVPARVERVAFAAGSQVARGDVLFELAPEGV